MIPIPVVACVKFLRAFIIGKTAEASGWMDGQQIQ
jgi:hypothetical protein